MLQDSFGRVHDYLRISLTDHCNFRCTYCMPQEEMEWMPQSKLMSKEEILTLAETFVGLGVKKDSIDRGRTFGEERVSGDFGAIGCFSGRAYTYHQRGPDSQTYRSVEKKPAFDRSTSAWTRSTGKSF